MGEGNENKNEGIAFLYICNEQCENKTVPSEVWAATKAKFALDWRWWLEAPPRPQSGSPRARSGAWGLPPRPPGPRPGAPSSGASGASHFRPAPVPADAGGGGEGPRGLGSGEEGTPFGCAAAL